MKNYVCAALFLSSLAWRAGAQSTFMVTGTPLPVTWVTQNYGKMPKGIAAYDLSICNASTAKQSLPSSEVYQALSRANPALQPLGREVVLSSTLASQNWNAARIIGLVLTLAVDVLSIAIAAKSGGKGTSIAAAAVGSLSLQQLTTGLKPAPTADQIEKLETQVLEPALALDAGSCVERTIFTANVDPKPKKAQALSFHVR